MKIRFLSKWPAPGAAIRLAVLPLLLAATVGADTIEMKSGERVDGAFKQASAAGAVIEVAGQAITIPLEKVKAIYFGAAPNPTGAGPTPLQEAIDALRALRSVTESGIAYRDYASRVLDAKVKVDKYLSSAGNNLTESQKALQTAMREYELTSQAWGSQFSGASNYDSIGATLMQDPEISTCPDVKQIIDSVPPSPGGKSIPREARVAIRVGVQPALLWRCAGAKVTESERLISQH